MKKNESLVTLLIVAAVLFSAAFACNTNDTSNTNTGSTSTNTGSTSTKTTDTKSKDIAGKYDATGTNPNGSKYKADLVVTPRDDVYQFSWTSGKASYDGVGVMNDNEVAVSFTSGSNGKGCGVVLYKIGGDGGLDGKVGYWGNNTLETEHATRTKGSVSDLDGVYDITSKNPEGKEYKGTLTVIQSGEGYTFDWVAGNSFSGYGLRAGNYIAVGFGGRQCAFVGYDVGPDGTLDGKWGMQGQTKFGTEVAKKK